jgi:hypothetical protein
MFGVKNFTYNGFCGTELSGTAPYKAEFKEWTDDPGIAIFHCSDGKERHIPTFAIVGDKSVIPKQFYENKIIFGMPSHS